MFSNHIVEKLSAYSQQELPPEEGAQIEQHLSACPHCQEAWESIKLGIRLAQHLTLLPIPPVELRGVFSNQKHKKPAIATGWAILCVGLSFLFIFGGYWVSRSGWRAPVRAGWEVSRLAGAPRVGGTAMKSKGSLALGEWLETDQNSQAQVKVAEIGYLEVAPNSRLQLVTSQSTEHRINLQQGKVSAVIVAPPRLFLVDTPSATAVDLGCAYTLEVDEAGNSFLQVTAGWVSIVRQGREVPIPAGARCVTRQGEGLGTPYFVDATPAFQAALAQLDFDRRAPLATPLARLLAEARALDGLTLWHLLQQTDKFSGSDRGQIYDRLAALLPPPLGVTREGILAGDQPMLDLWHLQKIH
ncbi:MAG: zf-HC2 domain-containing protein [Blastocatellia bacterium]